MTFLKIPQCRFLKLGAFSFAKSPSPYDVIFRQKNVTSRCDIYSILIIRRILGGLKNKRDFEKVGEKYDLGLCVRKSGRTRP